MNFLSGNKYISLPPFVKAKVHLAVDTAAIAKNSLKLYRVYSAKAIFLKKVLQLLASASILSLFAHKEKHSSFAKFLASELKLDTAALVFSAYIATDGDKIILQIQVDHKILGYVKYALNDAGKEKLQRELSGIAKVKELGMHSLDIFHEGSYEGYPFFISREVEENETNRKEGEPDFTACLAKLKQKESFPLQAHPRFTLLRDFFASKNQKDALSLIDKLSAESSASYALAYEHGDFCPWNVFVLGDRISLFDLEFFEEKGIEYFDDIAYHFRVATHLKGLDGQELFQYVSNRVTLPEPEIMFKLFLLKEKMETYTCGRAHMINLDNLLSQKF